MRSLRRARWLTFAIALSFFTPAALADSTRKKRRSIESCASFDQVDRADEDGVDFVVGNSCDIKLSCGVKWSLTCAPGGKKEKTTRHGAAFELEDGQTGGAEASTSECGNAGWEISNISWSCEPI
jgi:hypothetical protein